MFTIDAKKKKKKKKKCLNNHTRTFRVHMGEGTEGAQIKGG